MGSLLKFIIRHGAVILFFLLQAVCILLIYNKNPYQRNLLLSAEQHIAGATYGFANNVSGYFHLRTENQALLEKNAELEKQILQMNMILNMIEKSDLFIPVVTEEYNEYFAEVVNNSISRFNNYITLNKGRKDGIREHMGVINQGGVVGIVSHVTENNSLVISLLNTKLRISCRIKGDDAIGSLSWDGVDPEYAYVNELPRHAVFSMGDTIITSGYSAIFPEGIMIGTIEEAEDKRNDFNTVKVRLSADFYRLRFVRVIDNIQREERTLLENEVLKNE